VNEPAVTTPGWTRLVRSEGAPPRGRDGRGRRERRRPTRGGVRGPPVRRAEAAALGGVPAERPGAVGEHEAGVGGHAGDVGAVVAADRARA
jgi:hypothetical protein